MKPATPRACTPPPDSWSHSPRSRRKPPLITVHQPIQERRSPIENPEHEPTREVEPLDYPRIYVASLSDYNAGRLHGHWIDARQPLEDIHEEITTMLAQSHQPNAEEYAIHDHSGFAGWRLSEYTAVSDVHTVASAIEEHGPAVTHWIDYLGDEPQSAIDSFEDAYLGTWRSSKEYAEQLADDVGLTIEVDPPSWDSYVRFDAEALARDLDIELYVTEADDGDVHIFNPLAADG